MTPVKMRPPSACADTATAGGILVLAGTSLFLRSLVLAAYAMGLAVVTQTGQVEIEDPELDGFIGRSRKS